MEINISNLGTIKEGKLELGKLTILGGKNNSGKTYVAYAIYGFLKNWITLFSKIHFNKETLSLLDNGISKIDINTNCVFLNEILSKYSQNYSKQLYRIFNSKEKLFENTKVQLFIDSKTLYETFNFSIKTDDGTLKIVKTSNSNYLEASFTKGKKHVPFPKKYLIFLIQGLVKYFLKFRLTQGTHVITSERTGIQTFQKELDAYRSNLIDNLSGSTFEIEHVHPKSIIEQKTARYSLPIRDNISQARDLSEAYKQTSFLVEKNPKFQLGAERISGVRFNVDENGRITIASKEGEEKFAIDLHLASSSSRALLGLHTYIKHLAKENELLIIDEPELNLHPKNQIYLARLIAELVNNGVRVLITTHSDFFLKEINNLIALHSDFEGKDKIVKDYDYSEDELLSPEDVRAYICGEGTIREVEVDEFGLTETSFDDAMDMINEISEEIAFRKSMNPVKA